MMADRSSVTSAALTMLVPAVSLELVKTCDKVTCTDWAAIIVTTQGPVPAQPPPLHPLKDAPDPGVTVSVTIVPLA